MLSGIDLLDTLS